MASSLKRILTRFFDSQPGLNHQAVVLKRNFDFRTALWAEPISRTQDFINFWTAQKEGTYAICK